MSYLKKRNTFYSKISEYRPYIAIMLVYFAGFLFITSLGKFAPKSPPARSFSLINISPVDDTTYYMVGKSLLVDGDLDYKDERLNPKLLKSLNALANPSVGERAPIGPSLLWSPYTALGHLSTKILNRHFGAEFREDGYSKVQLAMTTLGSSMYGLLGLFIGFYILRLYFSSDMAFLSILTVFWGNSVFFFSYYRMLMSHASEFFSTGLFFLLFILVVKRNRTVDYIWLGISIGLMVVVRYDNAIFLLLPCIDLFFCVLECRRKRSWTALIDKTKKYSLGVLFALLLPAAQFIHFHVQSGSWVPSSLKAKLGDSFVTEKISLKELFFGRNRNILIGHPVVFISAISAFFFIRKERILGISIVVAIMAGILWLFNRPHVYWWGMDYGIRHLVKLSIPLSFGYAVFVSIIKDKSKVALAWILSFFIIAWEYLKIMKYMDGLSPLDSDYIAKAFSQIPLFLEHGFSNVFLGTHCSYLRTLVNYGLKLEGFSLNDILFLVGYPIYAFSICLVNLFLFVTVKEICQRRNSLARWLLVCVCVFLVSISLLFLNFDGKDRRFIYSDFKLKAFETFLEEDYKTARRLFLGSLDYAPAEEDEIAKGYVELIDSGVPFPYAGFDEAFRLFDKTSESDNPRVSEIGKFLIETYKAAENGLYDIGTDNANWILDEGWSPGAMAENNTSAGTLNFMWGVGKRSLFHLYCQFDDADHLLILRGTPPPFLENQAMKIYANQNYVDGIHVLSGWRVYEVEVPRQTLQKGMNEFIVEYKYSAKPSNFGGVDQRDLAFGVDRIEFREVAPKKEVPK